jgi:hypothetical protein
MSRDVIKQVPQKCSLQTVNQHVWTEEKYLNNKDDKLILGIGFLNVITRVFFF